MKKKRKKELQFIIKILLLFHKPFSSELLSKSPGNLLRNFLRHVLEMKSGEELQQKVYNSVLRIPVGEKDVLTLTLLDKTEMKVSQSVLLSSISASGIPLNNVKRIQVRLKRISVKDWEALYLQTGTGTELEIDHTGGFSGVDFSPRIHEMLQSSRLTKFRSANYLNTIDQ